MNEWMFYAQLRNAERKFNQTWYTRYLDPLEPLGVKAMIQNINTLFDAKLQT